MAAWKPLGKMILVRLQTVGSALEIVGDEKYNGLATVIAVGDGFGDTVGPPRVGDVVLLNGPQGIIAHPELGEHIALVAGPLVLARRVEEAAN
jgi:hypothetical protein